MTPLGNSAMTVRLEVDAQQTMLQHQKMGSMKRNNLLQDSQQSSAERINKRQAINQHSLETQQWKEGGSHGPPPNIKGVLIDVVT